MPVLRHIGMLATCRFEGGQSAIHAARNAALAWEEDEILWAGPDTELPAQYQELRQVRDFEGCLVVPGLIDCHTHLAFGGWRADEFEQRLSGRSYQEIAKSGGGILRTVTATAETSDIDLIARCRAALAEMAKLGVTTVEAKTGYGLTVEGEIRLLEIYKSLEESQPIAIVPTLLAAHACPPEFERNRIFYIESICRDMIPEAANRGLASFCDVFLEQGAFIKDEVKLIFEAARWHGLGLKIHADQLSDTGGASLAASFGAASADHLDCISEGGIRALAASGTVAVSLPLASLYLGRPPMPARRLIQAGVPVAVATDFNPGTAPSFHLPLAMLLACTMQRMTPAEVLKGATIYAAKAIGEEDDVGSLEPGKRADFAVIEAPDVSHWLYHFALHRCLATYIGGEKLGG